MKIDPFIKLAVLFIAIQCCCYQAAVAAPATLTQTVSHEGEEITLQLKKEDLRGAHFELLAQNSTGGYDAITPVEERSYLGTVDEYPDAVACGILQDDGTFRGAVYFDRGVHWNVLDDAVTGTRATDYAPDVFSDFKIPTADYVAPDQAGATMYGFDVAIDADNTMFSNACGSSIAKTFEMIEYSVCVTRALYMRDLLIRPYLARVVIRAVGGHDPYMGALGSSACLDAVRAEWQANQTDAPRNLVAGIFKDRMGGGLATVRGFGTTSHYSANQCNSDGAFDVVFRHEIGHSFGGTHFIGDNPEGTGIMGGNKTSRFSSCEVNQVFSLRDDKLGHFDNEGTFTAVELPPYASMDVVEFDRMIHTALVIDVLANDYDANGQSLSLQSHDATSKHGGTITRHNQTLIYTAPGSLVGADSFMYQISDSNGNTASGVCIIDVNEGGPLLHLALDDSSGTTPDDASIYNHEAFLKGTTFTESSVDGHFGKALELRETGDYMTAVGVPLVSNAVTITAWVRQGAPAGQNDHAAILVSRDNTLDSGLRIGVNGELDYAWNGVASGWNSGLVPPADTWTFVALVATPDQMTLYMDSGGGMLSATHTGSFDVVDFAFIYMGYSRTTRANFLGSLDDVRLYGYALSQEEAENVKTENAVGVRRASPFDGAWDVGLVDLGWDAFTGATQYHVYLGTDETVVRNATASSVEYLGAVTSTDYPATTTLAADTKYFWRVDADTPGGIIPGDVWTFTRSGAEPVSISNHSFELPDDGQQGQWSTVPNWNSDAEDATTDVVKTSKGSTDGIWAGFLEPGGSSVWNLTNHTISANQTFKLQVDARRTYASGYTLRGSLYYDDMGARQTMSTQDFSIASDWDGYELQIDNLPAAAIGKKLGIEFSNPVSGTLAIDNVRLTSGKPPPPSPGWTANPLIKPAATENISYSNSLAADVSNPGGGSLTFIKISGPDWLDLAGDGTINGTPAHDDFGENIWAVAVTDQESSPAITTVSITIQQDTIPQDTDDDEIPDVWETANGLNPNIDDRTENLDGDLFDNWSEYLADTRANDATSRQLLSIVVEAETGIPSLRFNTSANRVYTVQYSDDLTADNWSDLNLSVQGSGEVMTVRDVDHPDTRFYRLKMTLP